MTKAQAAKLERFRHLAAVFSENGLAIAGQPPMVRGVKWFRSALVGLEEVAARKLPADATAWEAEDHKTLLAAAFDAVGSALRDGIEPHLEFYRSAAPRFYGAIRGALLGGRPR